MIMESTIELTNTSIKFILQLENIVCSTWQVKLRIPAAISLYTSQGYFPQALVRITQTMIS
ncbi:hypothetical protein NADFUDRAFT_81382 [Nadsonia fulvescens var. elongata DSM 6958]|uniref:Uncharacterized protein n=1 Tax=Nadsonia fulvescens var. elongata DSM 6958 TaxID=857566 RepID=A0A1E3PSV1_9ASCO|nr:hypothetical protein NADFUDRAFT_81382 [Nadsonia fulvescens var. elongata DSM 6958]